MKTQVQPKEFIRRLYQDLTRAKAQIGWLKASADLETIFRVAKALPQPPHPLSTHFHGHPWQRSLSDLFSRRTQLSSGSLVAELQWTAVTIASNASALNRFFSFRQEYERNFLLGEFDSAAKSRDEIDAEFGVSLWGLQAKFLLLEYTAGLEANTRYLSELNTQKTLHIFMQVIANHLSMRAEKQLSHDNYQHKLAKYLTGFDSYPHVKLFFEHTTGRDGTELETNQEDMVLYYLSDGSLVDRCLHTISLLQRFLTAKLDDRALIMPSTKLICESLNTPATRNLSAAFMSELQIEPTSLDLSVVDALNHYTVGEYQKTAELTSQLLLQIPTSIQLYELYVKSLIFSGKRFESG